MSSEQGSGIRIERLGRILFHWRGLVGFIGFLIVFWWNRPTVGSCLLSVPIVLVGLGLRFWAMGYIGKAARGNEIGAEKLVQGGPYRLFKLRRSSATGHPLYAGNFLLVIGTLFALRPPFVLGVVILGLFLVEYSLIAWAEERFLAGSFAEPTRDGFSFRNAATEWQTLVVMVLIYAFGFLKA